MNDLEKSVRAELISILNPELDDEKVMSPYWLAKTRVDDDGSIQDVSFIQSGYRVALLADLSRVPRLNKVPSSNYLSKTIRSPSESCQFRNHREELGVSPPHSPSLKKRATTLTGCHSGLYLVPVDMPASLYS